MSKMETSNPPDLGVNVSESTEAIDVVGGMPIDLEKKPEILNQWIEHAWQTPLRQVLLVYILRNHTNADVHTLERLLDERLKHQNPRQ